MSTLKTKTRKKRIVKILLVDDHQMVRTGLKLMLSQQKSFIAKVKEAKDGEEAVKLVEKEEFDIMLLDVNLPKMDGVAVIKYCSQKEIKIPILAITMHREEHVVKQVVEAGAHGYLIKNCGIEELTKAINTVLNYKFYYCNEAAQSLLAKTSRKKQRQYDNMAVFSALTEREKHIIKLVAEEMTNTEVAKKLKISKRTVEGHRAKINSKIQVRNTAGLIRFAIANGIIS